MIYQDSPAATPGEKSSHHTGKQKMNPTYAIHDPHNHKTICLITITQELDQKLQTLNPDKEYYHKIGKNEDTKEYYRLIPKTEWQNKKLNHIKQEYQNLTPRHHSIDKFLDKLSQILQEPEHHSNPTYGNEPINTLWELTQTLQHHHPQLELSPHLVPPPEETPPLLNHFQQVIIELEKLGHNGTIDEAEFLNIDKNNYLLRYGKDDDNSGNYLVVMGDLGITWEPARAYHTEKIGEISGKDPASDAQALVEILAGYSDDEENDEEE